MNHITIIEQLVAALDNLTNYVHNNLSSDYPTGVDTGSKEFEAADAAITAAREYLAAPQGEPFGWFKQSELEQAKRYGGSINLWLQKYSDCDTAVYTRSAPEAKQELVAAQQGEAVAEVAGSQGNLHIKFLPAGTSLQLGDKLYTTPQSEEKLASISALMEMTREKHRYKAALEIAFSYLTEDQAEEVIKKIPQEVKRPEPVAAPQGEANYSHIYSVTTAYEQGVGKGHQAFEGNKEIRNPYVEPSDWATAWAIGYQEGKAQAEKTHPTPQPEPAELTDEAKDDLVSNWFAEEWAQDKARKLLGDYDTLLAEQRSKT